MYMLTSVEQTIIVDPSRLWCFFLPPTLLPLLEKESDF